MINKTQSKWLALRFVWILANKIGIPGVCPE